MRYTSRPPSLWRGALLRWSPLLRCQRRWPAHPRSNYGRRRVALQGGDYGTIALMGFDGELALMHADGAEELLQSWGAEMGRINEITIASLIKLGGYRPLHEIEQVNVPVRAVLATGDTISPAIVTRSALEQFEEIDMIEVPGGHFSVVLEQADAATTATVEWFARHL